MDDSDPVYCLQCDYDLRGLPDAGNCPECGLSIAESIKGRLLRFTDRESLTTLHSALLFLMVGTAFWTAYEIGRLTIRFTRPTLFVLTMLPLVVGLWWISIPDGRAEQRAAGIIRKLVRTYAVLAIANCAYVHWLGRYVDLIGFRPALALDMIAIVFLYAGQLALVLQLKSLAERIPSAKLSRFAVQLAIVAAAALLAVTVWLTAYAIQADAAHHHRHLHLPRLPAWYLRVVRWLFCVSNGLSILLMRGLYHRIQHQIDLGEPADDAPAPLSEQTIP